MKIEIEDLIPTKTNGPFWGYDKRRGMTGGKVKVSLGNGNEYSFQLRDFAFYVVHHTVGKGLTKKIIFNNNEENN